MIEIHGKSLILTDIHFGRKNFNISTFENTMKFVENVVFEELVNIKNLFILGDFFDNRKVIDWRIFNLVLEKFFDVLKELDVNVYMILGNHDIYFKDSLDVNSVSFLEKLYPNVTLFSKETYISFNDKKLLFVPWLTEETKFSHSNVKNADMVLGHFEIRDFEILVGHKAKEGLDPEVFNDIPVLSGHYHIKSKDKKIQYLGVCEQMSWNDFNTIKGCHILNEDLSLDFIENCISKKFIKMNINSSDVEPITIFGVKDRSMKYENFSKFHEEYDITNFNIKVIVQDRSDIIKFNNLIVELDSFSVKYIIIDETPEMLEKINISENEISDDNIDLVSIFKTQLSEEELPMFLEIFNEASQEIL